MISARFRIELPEGIWVGELSREYPQATFRLLSGYKIEDRAIELGDIRRDDPEEIVEAMRAHPSTTDTALYEFVEQSGFTIEFPIDVQAGWYEFDLTGTRAEFETLRDTLEAAPLPFELESIVHTTESGALLTDRQRELLESAVREGYFEVPRECTLAELAASIGVDKSTASTVLRRGEATLLKWYLSGPDTRW